MQVKPLENIGSVKDRLCKLQPSLKKERNEGLIFLYQDKVVSDFVVLDAKSLENSSVFTVII